MIQESARRWEDSDGFSSPEGLKLAGEVLSSMRYPLLTWALETFGSQLAAQLTAFCRQIGLGAGEAWCKVNYPISDICVSVLHGHGKQYLKGVPKNLHKALSLFEDATSLLIPGVTTIWPAYNLQTDHAVTLHALGLVDEARGVVVNLIDCIRHSTNIDIHDQRTIWRLRSLGIWPPEFDYLLELKYGDLPFWWLYWRQEQFEPQPLPSPPHNSLPPSLAFHSPSPDHFPKSTFSTSDAEDESQSPPPSFIAHEPRTEIA